MKISWFSLEMVTVTVKVKFQFWSAELMVLPFRLSFFQGYKIDQLT